MHNWRPRWTLKIGLRLLGLALLATLWPEGRALAALAHGHPAVTIGQLSLAALAFLCASGGMALLLMGPDLWKIFLSSLGALLLPPPPQFELRLVIFQ